MLPRSALFRPVTVVALTTAASAALARGGIALSADPHGIAPVWLANAILLGALLRSPRERRLPLVAACFLANVGVNSWTGMPLFRGIMFSAINMAEVSLAFVLLGRQARSSLDLTHLPDLLRFSVIAGLFVPVLSGLLATLTLSIGTGAVQWAQWPNWWATSALGLLIGTPMVIALIDSGAELRLLTRRKTIEGVAVIALGLGGTALLFAQALIRCCSWPGRWWC